MGAPRFPSGPRGPGGVRMPQGMGSEFNGVSFEITYLEFNGKLIKLSLSIHSATRTTDDAKQHGPDETR